MPRPERVVLALTLVLSCLVSLPPAAPAVSAEEATDRVETRQVIIMSEGTRATADVYSLASLAGKKLPTVIMSHGWGGTAALLKPQATDFARAGYLVVVLDYRGWGNSDSRVVLSGIPPLARTGTRFKADVLEIREVVDPLDQVTDLFNAIHWVMGEPMADPGRVGLWGTSYSGGHVVHVAAHDPRIRAVVSQVGYMDSRSAITRDPELLARAYSEATRRARGELGYPEPRVREVGDLQGGPIREKLLRYSPLDDVPRVRDCALLIIVAEKEELFDNREHGERAYQLASEPKKYVVVPGITHYGIYREARAEATKLAIDWFDRYLKR